MCNGRFFMYTNDGTYPLQVYTFVHNLIFILHCTYYIYKSWFTDVDVFMYTYNSRWWQLNYFLCSPRTLGKSSNLTNIFQMGWNHQTEFYINMNYDQRVFACWLWFPAPNGSVFFSQRFPRENRSAGCLLLGNWCFFLCVTWFFVVALFFFWKMPVGEILYFLVDRDWISIDK